MWREEGSERWDLFFRFNVSALVVVEYIHIHFRPLPRLTFYTRLANHNQVLELFVEPFGSLYIEW